MIASDDSFTPQNRFRIGANLNISLGFVVQYRLLLFSGPTLGNDAIELVQAGNKVLAWSVASSETIPIHSLRWFQVQIDT